MVYIPSATYRLQLSPKFKLEEVRKLIPYLHDLGISTIYAAPFFTTKPGSEHGYDVADPHEINPEVGTLAELQEISQELKKHGMGWLQDIVPNHMAYHPKNRWLMDVLEKGQKSELYNFFDIDFTHPDFEGKLMVPFLGEPLEDILKQKQIKIMFGENGFQVAYFDNMYPLSISAYDTLLKQIAEHISDDKAQASFQGHIGSIFRMIQSDKINVAEWSQQKMALYGDAQKNAAIQQAVDQVLEQLNNDETALQNILDQQFYLLCNWQITEEKINFRRFFTVNDLICLRMENQDVFDRYHDFIKQLTDQGIFQGLRVDHVDGLFDPDGYLEKLRAMAGEDKYLVVEKILEGEENLPEYWDIQGNSGYDFLAWVSNLYTDATGERKLTQLYRRLVPGARTDYEKLVFEKKIYMLEHHMQGELQNLLRILKNSDLLTDAYTDEEWSTALATLLSSFPVYRIYGNKFPLSEEAIEIIDKAFDEAAKRTPEAKAQLNHLRTLFDHDAQDSEEREQAKLYFVMRSQQFTGPLAAKGVEDTTFYNYNRLISLNEVGNSPDVFHIKRRDFHELMQYKLETYPHSINATATHDTKRGEGSRMRLEVLSELPEEWEKAVQQWQEIAQKYVTEVGPTPNDLYFIFQTLVGVMPIDGTVDDTLVERVQEYLTKAFREAKVNSNWTEPNEAYESAVSNLVQKLLQEDKAFLETFMPFFKRTAHFGWIYSLCQTMLKVACPGVPDIYQGCELWDFSLVDPDNRRPVDYELRQQYLQEMKAQEEKDEKALQQQLLQDPSDARVKQYLIYKVLNLRLQLKALFDHGDYIPLTFTGKYKENVIAFARHHEGQWLIVAVPRLLAGIVSENELPLGEQVWEDTGIKLPESAPKNWKNLFGQGDLTGQDSLALALIFDTYPVALLIATEA
ncbi:malto-oligosyltrehalose synthase [Pontibacter sp. SGAir0037]|uniref:malto-oligosyltrehalose synthase n=1 Tax=Pontibacter sp. SGAir0037 TaxID=2571030 RepID=UPI0010CCDDAA|nr:malto-oligosyltrehalose synthase [Pontibacter sp. SGAir0037]QCR22798.1 malto-oligosyltrehalose synthase [Pontibacter sp. SGAir0037]